MPDTPTRRLVLKETTYQRQLFREPLADGIQLEMLLIPGGTYLMGSAASEPGSYETEYPQHDVTVPPVFMSRTPITQAQWRVVAGYPQVNQELDSDPSDFKGDNRPVEQVSWTDTQEFCARLTAHTRRTYRLPTEAEWEYACRAGSTTPFHYGETLSDELANYQATETFGRGIPGEYRAETTDVASFPPNAFGLHDMHGNVLEWCEDDWHDNYDGAPTDGSAWLDSDTEEDKDKLLRGGSWYDGPRDCRSAFRYNDSRGNRDVDFGFRVCCVPPRAFFS
jgi:formylglycine-generating enzyme required for sulfatase activity